SCRMEGSATLTIVTSIPTISRLMQQIHRISQGRRLFVDIYLLYVYKQISASVAAAREPGRDLGRERAQAMTASAWFRSAVLAEQREQAAAAVERLGGRGEVGLGEHGGLDAVERCLADLERERGCALGRRQAGGLRGADADRGAQLRLGEAEQ